MADEPSITRWSFQFGRKKEANPKDDVAAVANGQQTTTGQVTSNANSSNGNGHVNNASELSIYEQYRQARENAAANGVALPDGEKPKKALFPTFESAEMRTLAESLSRDIIRGSPDVKWDSIKGLENAKRLLKEAVVMPIKYPKYFTGLLSPWKGILLFGPPGTGK
nr:katanin p60 ATPase-containing subunit A-like 2 isoform X1 [Tanacetum cinerariifolium]